MKGEPNLIYLLRQRSDVEAAAHASNNALRFRLHPSSLRLGIGDDAAIIARADHAGETVITTDLLVENIDFRRSWMPPRWLGHKALAVSLSDVAAMGAHPCYALVSLGVPADVWETDFVHEFYEGWFALAAHYGVTLIGGDLSRTPEHIVIDSIVLGETVPGQTALRRDGARPGDLLYVTGKLGGAAAGLRELESRADKFQISDAESQISNFKSQIADLESQIPNFESQSSNLESELSDFRFQISDTEFEISNSLQRQLTPTPRVEWGLWLNQHRLATAMLDLSDGLSLDLARLCEASGVGAVVETDKLPLDSSLADALHGGEDFELLFTAPAALDVNNLPSELAAIGCTCIGHITQDPRLVLLQNGTETELKPAGFDHFTNPGQYPKR